MRLRRQPRQKVARANSVSGRTGRAEGTSLADFAPIESVSVELAEVPTGVTVAGLKVHVAPAGNPEQAKATVESKPF